MKGAALVVCLVTNAYLLAAMIGFAVVSYPQFASVDRSVFPAVYSAFTARIGFAVVPFEFLALILTFPLYAWRPESMTSGSVHVLVALGVAYFAITFGWHLPAHRALAAGDNSDLSVLLTSQWARTVVQVVRVAVLGWVSARAMG